ncbi:phage/plasmid primase, P4 family [Kitasatospora sp. A2-31]|uniref:phage/plasmid primase, P4 family n=1 Tax=Kitasatospora sp. A2-31 TaxID=2916414 RepID=UPI001EEF7439|nr:phage/plasmid primase, P4 family [Kitasatospora sp. A2-31]MCG6499426.1 phage/plasmid primase, P4 family [Kitasatospora sp. A2-31]
MSTTPPPDTLAAALAWHAAGASVVRVALDGTKRPLGDWKGAQSVRATEDQIRTWFADGHPGLGVVMGAVSGGLEMFEFEGRAVEEGLAAQYNEIVEASGLAEVWNAVKCGYTDRSPSGGFHVVWRVVNGPVAGNTKLAARPARPEELTDRERQVLAERPGKIFQRDLIETRGDGGQSVMAPSHGPVHDTGLPYVLLAGGPSTVAVINADERDALLEIARMLDQMPAVEPAPAPLPGPREPRWDDGGISPGDDFEARTPWADILTPHGWTHIVTQGRTAYWRRPGKTLGVSATTGHDPARDRLYVFTSSTEFDPERPYTKFGAYALLEHRGDHSAAAKELRRRGYGSRPQHLRPVPAAVPSPAAAEPNGTGRTALAVAAPPVDGTAALSITEPTPRRGTWPGSFTDDGNAVLFADQHHHQLRYVPERGMWLRWDTHRWVWDELGATIELARDLVRDLDPEDFRADEDLLKAARRHRSSSLSRRGITACLGLAQSDRRIATSAGHLDAAPRHLNTPGGIVDLQRGITLPSDPAALHSRSTTVTPDPTLPTPRWNTFLNDTFAADRDLIGFVQRLTGYSASADTGSHVLPFLFGAGQNGKSVLMDVLQMLLGDYAAPAPAGFLMVGRQEHSEEMARLQGLRLVVASEVNQDARFDEAKMKELTGGDSITARYMHRSFFTFKPTHHLWLMANHQPRVKGGGNSFWRRLRLVPFTQVVPEERKITGLAQLLVAEEGPGILAWIVQGAVAYFAGGLAEPAMVRAATQAYAAEEDHIGRFLEDCCLLGGAGSVRTEAGKLRAAYEMWCQSEGERALDARMLGRELKGRGITRRPSNGRYFYDGLALTTDEVADFLGGR